MLIWLTYRFKETIRALNRLIVHKGERQRQVAQFMTQNYYTKGKQVAKSWEHINHSEREGQTSDYA